MVTNPNETKAPEAPSPTCFMVDLDSVLDTRIGTALRIDPDCSMRLFENGYFTRDRDLFPGIDRKQFAELYKNRDRRTIKASMMTPMVDFMKEFILGSYKMNINTPFLREPKLIVNIFPYDLLEHEIDILRTGLAVRTGKLAEVVFVNQDPKTIRPNWLKKEVSVIAMYDPYQWLEDLQLLKVWDKETCPSVMLLGPLIARDLDVVNPNMMEFQTTMEGMTKPFIDLQLFHIKAFSVALPNQGRKNDNAGKDPQQARPTHTA